MRSNENSTWAAGQAIKYRKDDKTRLRVRPYLSQRVVVIALFLLAILVEQILQLIERVFFFLLIRWLRRRAFLLVSLATK